MFFINKNRMYCHLPKTVHVAINGGLTTHIYHSMIEIYDATYFRRQ